MKKNAAGFARKDDLPRKSFQSKPFRGLGGTRHGVNCGGWPQTNTAKEAVQAEATLPNLAGVSPKGGNSVRRSYLVARLYRSFRPKLAGSREGGFWPWGKRQILIKKAFLSKKAVFEPTISPLRTYETYPFLGIYTSFRKHIKVFV